MKTFIGTGVGQPEAAVHQAVQGLTSPSAILFMASYEHFKETASRLKELFPDTPCIGTIGTRLTQRQGHSAAWRPPVHRTAASGCGSFSPPLKSRS